MPVTARIVDRERWRRLASEFRDHNYRQCWEYAEAMARRTGAKTEQLCVNRRGRPLGLASLRIRSLPGMSTGIAYVSGGPLVRQGEADASESALETVLGELVSEYVDRRRLVLRVAPTIGDGEWNRAQERCFLKSGFRPREELRRYNTILVDLARPLEDVRAGFAKKWRYTLGRSERAEIEVAEGIDPTLMDDFQGLFGEFVARKSFAVDLGADFYAGVQAELHESERLYVAIASIDGKPAAGVVATLLGDTAVYLLGASNEAGRRAKAGYLLQWKAIEAASARNLRWYDLGGIDPDGNPGVYEFKSRMGGTELSAPGPYEIAPGRLRAGAVRTAERIFRVARRR
jgi:Acetyltransferase (GNAT) domain